MKKQIKNKILPLTVIFTLITLVSLFIKEKSLMLLTIGIILALTIILLLKNKNNKVFLTEIRSEIKNIHWPNKKEINQSMLIITLIIITASFVLWIIDSILTFCISKII